MPFFKGLIKSDRRSPPADHQAHTRQVVEGSSAEDAEDEGAAAEESADESTDDGAEAAAAEADSEEGGETMAGSSITVAPTLAGSQFTTSSVVVTSSSSRQDRRASAAHQFVYGHEDEPWNRPAAGGDETPVRPNRAQTMRQSCVSKRVQEAAKERSRVELQDEAWMGNEILDPIVARRVPPAVFEAPKIAIRGTKVSKFRYMYNRKPAGVKVYFKLAGDDERKRPPFVVAALSH